MSEIPKSPYRPSLLVSCGLCLKLHAPERPLEFDPVCDPCTAAEREAGIS